MRHILSVSLVTFNGSDYIHACLESIKRQTLSDIEVVIVDNASSDETVAIAREVIPHATIIESPSNLGFAAGHNLAISKSSGEYILVLNQDSVLEPDYCEKLISFLEKHQDAGSATGTILRCESLTEHGKKRIIDSQGMFILYRYFVRLRGEGSPFAEGRHDPEEVFGVPATVALYRKSALDDVAIPIDGKREYFDEDFFMYKEDVDLAYRMQWRGWRSFLIPEAICYHVRTKRSGARPHPWINELSYRNTVYYQRKNISKELFFRTGLSIVFFEIAKVFYSIYREPSSLLRIRDIAHTWRRMNAKRAWIMAHRKASERDILRFY